MERVASTELVWVEVLVGRCFERLGPGVRLQCVLHRCQGRPFLRVDQVLLRRCMRALVLGLVGMGLLKLAREGVLPRPELVLACRIPDKQFSAASSCRVVANTSRTVEVPLLLMELVHLHFA